MTVQAQRLIDPDDLSARDVRWDIQSLLAGEASVDGLLDTADAITAELVARGRGNIATMSANALIDFFRRYAEMIELTGRAENYAALMFAALTTAPENGARVAHVQQRVTAMSTQLLFIELEWAAATPEHVDEILADPQPGLDFVRHYLRSLRRYTPYVLSEPEERILAEKNVTGASAWARLFDEQTAALSVHLDQADGSPIVVPLAQALGQLQHFDRSVRQNTHDAITQGLEPGLRTRSFVLNTLLNDKMIDDRLRKYPTWISSRNLSNEASDESVQALVESVVRRYDIPQRWYALKAKILQLPRIADFDRMASVAVTDAQLPWSVATETVIDAYSSFSGELAGIVQRFLRESWVDAPNTPGKRPGAFCAYTVPSHHPYVMLNWAGRPRDLAVLAHELGHGVHAYLSREQGVFHMATPLTVAETASVFGETVTSNRLLATLTDPNERLALLASMLEDSIATVFRQISMNRFEHTIHTARRSTGELSVEQLNDAWEQTQTAMLGPAVEITAGYRTWWSYVPHFVHSPGYVYAYAYGQLLALSVYHQYELHGEAFVPQYLELLRAGGSMSPEDLGQIVGCDLRDPAFWDGGLAIVEGQLEAAELAARQAGRISATA